jgi:hypothetical protein
MARGAKPNTISKRGKFRLAAACAELMSDEQVAAWLLAVANGVDPAAPRNDDGTLRNPNPIPLDWAVRIRAMSMFLDRRNGKAPQSITVEDATAAASQAARAVASPAAIAAMDAGRKAQLRALLREVVSPRALPAAIVGARDANPPPEPSGDDGAGK